MGRGKIGLFIFKTEDNRILYANGNNQKEMVTLSTYYVLGAKSTITRQIYTLPLRNQQVNKQVIIYCDKCF